MKVCLVTGEFPPLHGGVGDYTSCLAHALARQGCQVAVVTSGRAVPQPEELPFEVWPVVQRWGFACWAVLSQEVQRLRPAVLHVQYQTGAFQMHPAVPLWLLRQRLAGRRPRLATTFHDLKLPYLFPKAGPVRRLPGWLMAWCADAVVTTNPEDAAALGQPSTLIPIGSNIPPHPPPNYDREAWRARCGVAPDELLLGYFGFLNPNKGVEMLFAALWRLLDGGLKARLLMIGGMASQSIAADQRYAEGVRARATALGLDLAIEWTGFLPPAEVTANLLATDLCVLPYLEGASLRNGTLVAAIVHGLAILTTQPPRAADPRRDAPGSLRLEDSVSARLIPPGDANALAEAILELHRDPVARASLRRGALAMASLFDWDEIARQHVQLYRRLGADRS